MERLHYIAVVQLFLDRRTVSNEEKELFFYASLSACSRSGRTDRIDLKLWDCYQNSYEPKMIS